MDINLRIRKVDSENPDLLGRVHSVYFPADNHFPTIPNGLSGTLGRGQRVPCLDSPRALRVHAQLLWRDAPHHPRLERLKIDALVLHALVMSHNAKNLQSSAIEFADTWAIAHL